MQQSLSELIPEFYPLLDERSFQIASSIYDRESFGNQIIELDLPRLRLRVVKDRGEVSVDVSVSGLTEWYGLSRVLEFLFPKEFDEEADGLNLAKQALLFDANYESVVEFFHNRAVMMKYKGFCETKRRRLIELFKSRYPKRKN